MTAHQALIAEHGAGADFDDRLKGIFDDELGEGQQLVIGKAAQDARLHRGARNHDLSPKSIVFYAGEVALQFVKKTFLQCEGLMKVVCHVPEARP
ncbi:hypothetical protein D3C72_2236740 [compost metagenome]